MSRAEIIVGVVVLIILVLWAGTVYSWFGL